MFQGWLSVSWGWWTSRATKHQQNDRKCWKNSRTHLRRPSPNNPWARRQHWDQLWSLLGDLNRKFEHAPHCHEVCSPTNYQRQQSINVCLELWEKANEDTTSISRIITGDKSDKKQSNSHHRHGRSGVQQRPCSLFFSIWKGLFTVNLFLLTLWSTLTLLCCDHNWLLHHDNAPSQTSLKTTVCD
jgi:hypothetical protein